MKTLLPTFCFLLSTLLLNCQNPSLLSEKEKIDLLLKTRIKSQEALDFCISNHYNSSYCFMLDLSIHSGKNRFFVWDLKNSVVLDSGLVSHGSCKQSLTSTLTQGKVSNVPNSHCSSLGKYRIGNRDYSNWGINIKYWIIGLEESNNNAVDRVVVLHSWEQIKDREIFPNLCVESWGCPAVSNNFMERLDHKISKSNKPVLLWIYN